MFWMKWGMPAGVFVALIATMTFLMWLDTVSWGAR